MSRIPRAGILPSFAPSTGSDAGPAGPSLLSESDAGRSLSQARLDDKGFGAAAPEASKGGPRRACRSLFTRPRLAACYHAA